MREVGGEWVILLGDDSELLLGLLYISGANRSQCGQRKAARVTPSVCQTSRREKVLQAVGVGLEIDKYSYSGSVD